MKRCRKRGHRWVVMGFDPSTFAGTRPLVFLECGRCPARITAEIVAQNDCG